MKKQKSVPLKVPVESPAPTDDAAVVRDERSAVASFPIVGVGASAGGLEAFTQLLQALPLDTGMGFVLVQHLDPHHKSLLVELLGAGAPIPVLEAADGVAIRENCAFVIPPDATLTIKDGILRVVSPAPPREFAAP